MATQATSSFWDPGNMANWGIQKVRPSPSQLPSSTPATASITVQNVEIELPYLPPHLAAIRDSKLRSRSASTSSSMSTSISSVDTAPTAISTSPYLPPHLAAIRDSTVLSASREEILEGRTASSYTKASSNVSGTSTAPRIVSDVPYLPPHLAAIRDSTVLSDSTKEKHLTGRSVSTPTIVPTNSSGTSTAPTIVASLPYLPPQLAAIRDSKVRSASTNISGTPTTSTVAAGLPYLPPHLAAIRDSKIHSASTKEKLLKDRIVSTPVSTNIIVTSTALTVVPDVPYLPPHLADIRDSKVLSVSTTEKLLKNSIVAAPKSTSTSPPSDPQQSITETSIPLRLNSCPEQYNGAKYSSQYYSSQHYNNQNYSNQKYKSQSYQSQSYNSQSYNNQKYNYNRQLDLPPPENDHIGASLLRNWLDNNSAPRKIYHSSPERHSYFNSSSSFYPSSSEDEGTHTTTKPRYGSKGYVPPAMRPKKTMDVVQRMIYHDLGMKMPRKTRGVGVENERAV